MIKSIHFKNFKVLREATLPLGPFTLIVGPNGSGKSTAMEAFNFIQRSNIYDYSKTVTAGLPEPRDIEVQLTDDVTGHTKSAVLHHPDWHDEDPQLPEEDAGSLHNPEEDVNYLSPFETALASFKVYSLEAKSIARPVGIDSMPELREDGFGLANVLDDLSDQEPERWEALNRELSRWLPEFDHVTFERASNSTKIFQLRTRVGHHKYNASDLSQGTLFAVALLTLAYLKNPPAIVCFEEPDHGIHPRLLQNIQDAMYRLAYPKDFGGNREPVQVIATTHSPYLLDLYKEHPEEIVIAHKDEQGAHFELLSEKPHIAEILEGAPLGDIWFSGVLGGVPANTWKIAVVSESLVDEAAIKILVDKIVGSESELHSLRARPDGWTKIFEVLPGIINTLHYGTDVEALVVVVDSDESPPHQKSHDQSPLTNPECRLCRLRDTVRVVITKVKPLPNRAGLKTALGLAVPAIEAWYRCGIDTHVNEVAWSRKLLGQNVGYDRRSLKKDTYGSYRPNMDAAVLAAKRAANNLGLLERLFPDGFGCLLRDVRSWTE